MQVIKTFANKASTDLTGYEGYAAEYDTSGINVCNAITDKAIGIITKGGATVSEVCIFGDCDAKAGGAIGAGKFLSSHTDGTLVVTASTAIEFALALQDIASGAFGPVFVTGSRNTAA